MVWLLVKGGWIAFCDSDGEWLLVFTPPDSLSESGAVYVGGQVTFESGSHE